MFLGFVVGLLLRYALFFANASSQLQEHLELTSPITSFLPLQEAFFLMEAGVSPYEGSMCRQPPLFLLLLYPLRHAGSMVHFSLLALVDVLVAVLLGRIASLYADAKQAGGYQKLLSDTADGDNTNLSLEAVFGPNFVAMAYFMHPFVIAGSLALSFQNFHFLTMISCIYFAAIGRGALSASMLALALYLVPWTPIILLLPVAFLAFVQSGRITLAAPTEYHPSVEDTLWAPGFLLYLVRFAIVVAILFVCLLCASLAMMEFRAHFFKVSFLSILQAKDLTPNIGLFWYTFIEIFDRFRFLFVWAFHGMVLFLPLALHLRIGRHVPLGPWVQCGAAIGIVTLFRPYPTAGDHALTLAMLLIQAELIKESQKQFVFLLSASTFGVCMCPTMVAVWITRNAGNANFLYNMTLVAHVFAGLLLGEWLKAGIKLRHRQHLALYCRNIVLDAVKALPFDTLIAGSGGMDESEWNVVESSSATASGEVQASTVRKRR